MGRASRRKRETTRLERIARTARPQEQERPPLTEAEKDVAREMGYVVDAPVGPFIGTSAAGTRHWGTPDFDHDGRGHTFCGSSQELNNLHVTEDGELPDCQRCLAKPHAVSEGMLMTSFAAAGHNMRRTMELRRYERAFSDN